MRESVVYAVEVSNCLPVEFDTRTNTIRVASGARPLILFALLSVKIVKSEDGY